MHFYIVLTCSTNLREADLYNADLSGANLEYADLRGASLIGADLTGAYLTGAYLTDAVVTEEQLDRAKYLDGATMPDGRQNYEDWIKDMKARGSS